KGCFLSQFLPGLREVLSHFVGFSVAFACSALRRTGYAFLTGANLGSYVFPGSSVRSGASGATLMRPRASFSRSPRELRAKGLSFDPSANPCFTRCATAFSGASVTLPPTAFSPDISAAVAGLGPPGVVGWVRGGRYQWRGRVKP